MRLYVLAMMIGTLLLAACSDGALPNRSFGNKDDKEDDEDIAAGEAEKTSAGDDDADDDGEDDAGAEAGDDEAPPAAETPVERVTRQLVGTWDVVGAGNTFDSVTPASGDSWEFRPDGTSTFRLSPFNYVVTSETTVELKANNAATVTHNMEIHKLEEEKRLEVTIVALHGFKATYHFNWRSADTTPTPVTPVTPPASEDDDDDDD